MIPELSVSEFVAVFNQTLEATYSSIVIIGELANYKVSKNRWLYFDLKDDFASVRFFGAVQQLPGPLEDGMLLKVTAFPRLHPQFGFSLQVQQISLSGKGTIKKAAKLLEAKLAKEGLFAPERKRPLPYAPRVIGLITSGESAAYADFMKILNQRWCGVEVCHIDVQVQGEQAPSQIVAALEYFNAYENVPEVIVITRGGGSADDLQAFSSEQVTRAVAASRVPTLVAIGHEVDISLAERAADMRASTPSNAAELLVPDKKHEQVMLASRAKALSEYANTTIKAMQADLKTVRTFLSNATNNVLSNAQLFLKEHQKFLDMLSPEAVLARGYALVKHKNNFVMPTTKLVQGDEVTIILQRQEVRATIKDTKERKKL